MGSSTVTDYPENIQFSFAADRGNWTEEGCRVEEVDDETGFITCECNHLTNFAILVDINARTAERVLNRALEAFSIVGSIISMIGLILTLITMVGFR